MHTFESPYTVASYIVCGPYSDILYLVMIIVLGYWHWCGTAISHPLYQVGRRQSKQLVWLIYMYNYCQLDDFSSLCFSRFYLVKLFIFDTIGVFISKTITLLCSNALLIIRISTLRNSCLQRNYTWKEMYCVKVLAFTLFSIFWFSFYRWLRQHPRVLDMVFKKVKIDVYFSNFT